MNFAYYQGQEQEALAYYKGLLAKEADPEVRKALEAFVVGLEKVVTQLNKDNPRAPISLQNASLSW